ncbi:hypothetical protein [Nostoc sp. CMAA1605]|nr:hypothetical protein [Nostoc sp. CMAA1605]
MEWEKDGGFHFLHYNWVISSAFGGDRLQNGLTFVFQRWYCSLIPC